MKKLIGAVMAAVLMLTSVSCASKPEPPEIQPRLEEMKAICNLSVMECYYHNVAKYLEEDAAGHLLWKKDKRFWVEYSGVVKLGIDASLVSMELRGDEVTISMPEAKVLGCTVNEESLSKDSFIVDADSAHIKGEDEVKAFQMAQEQLQEKAANDKNLLMSAQDRAKQLLEDYVHNVGSAVGKTYTVKWNYLDAEGNPTEKSGEQSVLLPAQSSDVQEAAEKSTPEAS